ncbi:MAG: hypothetical protein JWN25_2797, partial [Verrucomicrobiales bacterium]|nr:hypothetical protein [Verrucomicrobiales bacterium]
RFATTWAELFRTFGALGLGSSARARTKGQECRATKFIGHMPPISKGAFLSSRRILRNFTTLAGWSWFVHVLCCSLGKRPLLSDKMKWSEPRKDWDFVLCFFVVIMHVSFDFFDLILLTSYPTKFLRCSRVGFYLLTFFAVG